MSLSGRSREVLFSGKRRDVPMRYLNYTRFGALLTLTSLVRLCSAAVEASGLAVTPVPEEFVSSVYRVAVNGVPVDVLGVPAPTHHHGQLPKEAEQPYYAAFFEATNVVTVAVSSDLMNLDKVRILPTSSGVVPKADGKGGIAFRAKPPFCLSVEPDGRHRGLIVSAKEPIADPPRPGAQGVLYFGPGHHRFDQPIRLKTGETMYLSPGAVVEAAVIGEGECNRICGHGILSGVPWKWCGGPSGHMLHLMGRNVRVEGITILGSYQWTLVLDRCEGAVVDGVNILNGRVLNDDGIDVVRCRNTTIRNCFIRSQDDCITPKHWCEGLRVENCALWTDVANIFRIGYECDGPSHRFRDFRITGIDVLHQSVRKPPTGALWSENAVYIQASNEMRFENMLFEDFRFDCSETGDNLINVRTIITRDQWQRHEHPGYVCNVTFRGFSFPGGLPERSQSVYLESIDDSHIVEGIRFEGLDPRIGIVVKGKVGYGMKK